MYIETLNHCFPCEAAFRAQTLCLRHQYGACVYVINTGQAVESLSFAHHVHIFKSRIF